MKSGLALALLLSMPSLAAQPAAYGYVDQRSPYSNPNSRIWPSRWLTAVNLPRIGTTFQVRVPTGFTTRPYGGGPPAGTTWLATGIRNPDLRFDPFYGYLFTSAEIVTVNPTKLFPDFATVSFRIPNSAQLVGAVFHQQVVVHIAGAPSPGPLSRGGRGVIGR